MAFIYYPDGNGGRVTLTAGGAGTDSECSLPTASASVKGGVKIGRGLRMNGETLDVTLSGGSESAAEGYGKIVAIPADFSSELEITNAEDWAIFNQSIFDEQAGWAGNVFIVLPKQFETGNYTIEHIHNVSDYSTIYPKESFIGAENAEGGYEIMFSSEENRYLLRIPAGAINWQTPVQLIIHGERQEKNSVSAERCFIPGFGLSMDGDTLNVTIGGTSEPCDCEFLLDTIPSTVEGAMWLNP